MVVKQLILRTLLILLDKKWVTEIPVSKQNVGVGKHSSRMIGIIFFIIFFIKVGFSSAEELGKRKTTDKKLDITTTTRKQPSLILIFVWRRQESWTKQTELQGIFSIADNCGNS